MKGDVVMSFGQRVRKRRLSFEDFTQEKLAKIIGHNGRSAINKIEMDRVSVKLDDLELYARALRTSPEYLLGWVNNPDLTHEDIFKNVESSLVTTSNETLEEIPIIGKVAAGNGAYADNDIVGYERVPSSWIKGSYQYVLLTVTGDSMYPKFEDGDLLLIRVQDVINSGDFGVALVDNDQGVVKKIIYDNNHIELVSVNPSVPPRRFDKSEMNRVRIFGVVQKCIRNV